MNHCTGVPFGGVIEINVPHSVGDIILRCLYGAVDPSDIDTTLAQTLLHYGDMYLLESVLTSRDQEDLYTKAPGNI